MIGMRGFSLTELILVTVIIGVLMVTALPRLTVGAFDITARADQLAADIRYAQSLSMTRAAAYGITITGAGWQIVDNGGNPVPSADGRTGGSFGDASVSGFSGTISFNNVFGDPDIVTDATVTLTADGASANVVVRALTGYAEVM